MLGAGERIRTLPPGQPVHHVIVPSEYSLSTPAVYREFDAGSSQRGEVELAELEARDAWPVHNDLQDAARRLCPSIDDALAAVSATGADHALVSGSGPTVFGLYGSRERAEAAAREVGGIAAEPVGPAFAEVRTR
jgi:4-diphosphocytidyl-2-C-methyl-D-erythritol kinase